MKRPYVKLSSENRLSELLTALDKSLPRFTALEGVVGIILDGGLSRGYGDHLSEIDIIIYVEAAEFVRYNEGACPFALGITKLDGYLYDIKLANFTEESQRDYDSVALWDLSYAAILYDPEGKVANFIEQKLANPVVISSASGLLWDAYWHYKLAGDIWIHRQDALQGHFVLNNAIKPLLGALFIANGEYIPHDKWLVHMSKSLAWKPDNWDAVLRGIMCTADYSVESLRDRQQCIADLWQSINHKLCAMSDFHSELDFVQKESYESLTRLMNKREYTIDEWTAVESLESLNYEPIHSIFKNTGDKIILDQDALLSLQPEDMYIWMYQIANEARKKLTE